jgi:preprotein translocase subunit Sss1
MSQSTNGYPSAADRKEFVKICQAVGVGFLIMGAVGYVVKLSRIPFSCSVRAP